MTMKVGKRLIEGEIKGRNAARKIYESAKAAGKVAGLLVPYPETSCKKARNLMATPGSRGQMSDVRGQ
jgi:hypothetical protein